MKKIKHLVIGGGPAGYCAAIRLAQLKQECILVEKHRVGGTCLNVGCIPSKALINAATQYSKILSESAILGISTENTKIDWSKTIKWKDQIVTKITGGVAFLLKKNGVETIQGIAELTDAKTVSVVDSNGKETEQIQAENILLATGSSIVELPEFPVDHKKILDSNSLLSLSILPKSMIILGGGIIGCELGGIYATLGVKVSIIEMLENILAPFEREAVKIVQKKLQSQGIDFYTKSKALNCKIEDDSVELNYEKDGQKMNLTAEILAVTVGRKPNVANLNLEKLNIKNERGQITINDKYQTSIANIYAVGDLVNGPALAHKASAEAIMAAESMSGEKVSRQDLRAIPNVVYTKPEIASIGIDEEFAKQNDIKVKVGKFPLSALGKSATVNETTGYLKYIAREEDHRIVGAVIVSSLASELISTAALAIEMAATLEDIALTIQAHPSFSEAHLEASATALKKAIHIINH